MYRIGKKVSIGVLCALFALVLTLVAVFALAPNTSAAHAETENTVVWDKEVLKKFPDYKENTELASIADAASNRTITLRSVNGYVSHNTHDDEVYDEVNEWYDYITIYDGAVFNNGYLAKGFTFSINNPSETSVTIFTKIEIKGEDSYFYNTPDDTGWSCDDSNAMWTGKSSIVDFDVQGYVQNVYEIKFTFKIVDGFVTTLNTNGGTINRGNVTFYETGKGATLPTDVTKNGYGFKGWYDNAAFDGDPVTAIGTDATGAKEFWAKWLPTVTFNTNDGVINSGEITEYIEGVGATLPTDVTKENCTFGGWYDNATFDGEPVTAIGTDATGGKTYWAKWICSVTLNTNGGTINSGDVTEYAEGVGATLPTDVTKEDAFFAGWYDNASFEGDPVTAIGTNDRGPKKYWAKYLDHIHEYSSDWSYDDSKHWHACTSTKGVCDAPVIDEAEHTFADSTDTTAYYICECGYEDAERKNTFYNTAGTFEIDTNTKQWSYKKQNVTINVNDRGDGDGSLVDNDRYMTISVKGNVVISRVTITIGFYYSWEWEGKGTPHALATAGSRSGDTFNNINAKTVKLSAPYRVFIKHIDVVTTPVNGITYELNGGTINEKIDVDYYDYYFNNQGRTLPTNVTRADYIFQGWYDNANFEGDPITAIPTGVTGNKTVWAKWKPTIIYNVTGGEIQDAEYATEFTPGVGATLPTTVTKDGYSFGGWYDNEDLEGVPVATIGTEVTETQTYWAKWYTVGYYFVGNTTDNKVAEECLLTKNTAETEIDEYYIDLHLSALDTFKVIYGTVVYGEEGRKDTLYPSGTGNEYVIPEDGLYRVYFRPNADGGEGWHYNVLLAKRLFAQIGTDRYHSLAEAYDAVSANGTIKLLDDVDLTSAAQLVVTQNVTLDLNGFILDITTVDNPTLADYKILATEGAIITLDDTNVAVGGVKGVCYPDVGSYIILKNCRLSMSAVFVRANSLINHTGKGYVVRDINEAPDADGFITIVRLGSNQEIADDVDELIFFIGDVVATVESKTLIETARNAYEALTDTQKELVSDLDTLEAAESTYITLVVGTIEALPEVGELVYGDKAAVENARTLYEALRDAEKEAFPAETLAVLEAAEADMEELKTAKAAEVAIDALPHSGTLTFADCDDLVRARIRYDALTDYQRSKISEERHVELTAKLEALESEAPYCHAAEIVNVQIDALPLPEDIMPWNQSRIESARAAYDALTDEEKAKVVQATVNKLVAAEDALAAVVIDLAAATDVADVIGAIGFVEFTAESHNRIDSARTQYEALTDNQKRFVDNYATLTSAEAKYLQLKSDHDADETAAAIALINAIGAVQNTPECAEKITAAREAFDALTAGQKEFVTNYETLEDAEIAYAAYTPVENVAKIEDDEYATFLAACEAARTGDVVKLMADIDLTGEVAAYITLRRDITIDLNGHILNIKSSDLSYIVWASDGAIITIDNTVPERGGVKGLIGADYLSGADIVLHSCRLTLSIEELNKYDAFISLDVDCVIMDINEGNPSVIGYSSIVYPIGDADYAAAVDKRIDAIGSVEYTDESQQLILSAREAFEALTEDQQLLVNNLATLEAAEGAYAALAAAEIDALIPAEITVVDKSDIETARSIYDSLNEQEKSYIAATLTELQNAETTLDAIIAGYTVNQEDCKHSLVQISSVTGATTYSHDGTMKWYDYRDDDVLNGTLGTRINFPSNSAHNIAPGNVTVIMTAYLYEAREIEIWWKFEKGWCAQTDLTITSNTGSTTSRTIRLTQAYDGWNVERISCPAGVSTFTFACVSQYPKTQVGDAGVDFYVVPQSYSMFGDGIVCSLCGAVCKHESIGFAYDEATGEYCYVCDETYGCRHKVDFSAIPDDQESSFTTARAAYDALTDEQKALIRPSELLILEKHEAFKSVIENEQVAIQETNAVNNVIALLKKVPDAADITLNDKTAIQAARTAYDALTAEQKTLIEQTLLDKLTAAESKYAELKEEDDTQKADAVTAVITALPAVDDITFEKRSLIEQARVVYEMLTSDQKAKVTSETKSVLSAAEVKGVIVSWEDFFPENGTYILVPVTDETKAMANSIKIAAYNEATINDNLTNNRNGKWKIVRQGNNVFYAFYSIYDATYNNADRLLDAAQWESSLSDGSKLALVSVNSDKSEYSTDVFRFSKRVGVDMDTDEYYLRAVSTSYNKYNYVITLRSGNGYNIGTYGAKNDYQVWKLIRVNGDEEFAQVVIDLIEPLPTYANTTLDHEETVVTVRTAYNGLTAYQQNLVTNRSVLFNAEQKIVDIKAANAVDVLITAIGEVSDTAESKTKIDTARAEYNKLTDNQKLLVVGLDTLVAAETTCAGYVTARINALPAVNNIDVDNTTIAAARAKYEALTAEEKSHVTDETMDKLTASESTLSIISLPEIGVADVSVVTTEKLTLANKPAVVAARTQYKALTNEAQALVGGFVDTLVAAETEIADLEAAKAVYDAIVALPAIANLTAANKTAVDAAVTAYGALTAYQKNKVPASSVDKLFAEETTAIILSLPAYEDMTLAHTAAVANADAYFDNLTDNQEALVLAEVKTILAIADKKIADMTAAKAVSDEIGAIGAVTYDLPCKTKIDSARENYNSLTGDQKAFLLNDEQNLFEYHYSDLQAKEADYAAHADEAINTMINMDVDEITGNDKDAVEAAWITYDELIDEEKEILRQEHPETVNKVFAAVATIDIIEIYSAGEIQEDISDENADAIKAAKKKYDDLTPAQKELIDDEVVNKVFASATTLEIIKLPDFVNIVAGDEDAIEAAKYTYEHLSPEQQQLVPDGAKNTLYASVTTLEIVELPVGEDIDTGDKDAIEAARAAFETLTPTQQGLVPQTTKDTLIAAEAVLEIVELPVGTNISEEDEDAIEAARAAYKDLTPEQQAKVPQATVDTLVAAETVLEIVKLPEAEEIGAGDEDAIVAARAAYDNLTPAQKSKVPSATVDTLVAAEAVLEIVELPVAEKIDTTDRTAIEAARAAYDDLTPAQKSKVPSATVDTLVAAETTLTIVELPQTNKIDVDDEDAILAAKAAYNELSEEQIALLPQESIDKLLASNAIVGVMGIIDTDAVDDNISIENALAINAAKAQYDDLTEGQQALVPAEIVNKIKTSATTLDIIQIPAATNIDETINDDDALAIHKAKATFDALTDTQKDMIRQEVKDKVYASAAAVTIVKLPDGEDIATTDRTAIEAARAVYTALTPEQQAKVPPATVDTLVAAETVLEIVELPVASKIAATDRTAIEAARAAYTALTADQKAKVPQTTVDTLVAAETVLEIVELPVAEKIDTTDRTAIEAARAAYDDLTPAQKSKVPSATVDTLVAAETTLTIVELPQTNKIDVDDEDAILAAKAAYNELSEEQIALLPQESIDKLFASATTISVVKIPAPDAINESIDEEAALAIKAAKAAYDNLSEDQQALVPTDLVNKVFASATTLAVLKIVDAGDINENISEEDGNAIIAAKAAYDAMTPVQKAMVPVELVNKLFASATTYAMVNMPDADEVTEEDADFIAMAKALYDELTKDQRDAMPKDTVDKLFAAATTLDIIQIPTATNINETINDDDALAIKAAKAAYDKLTDDQKALLPVDVVNKVLASSGALAIVELPVGVNISANDATAIAAARAAFDAYNTWVEETEGQQDLIPQTTVDTLVAAETVLDIVKLPVGTDISAEDEEAIEAARAAYDKLSDEQKKKVPPATVNTLVAAETTLTIVKLPAIDTIEIGNKDAIEAAKEAYDDLTETQKGLLPQTTKDKLFASTTTIAILEINAADAINGNIEAENANAIKAAKAAFDDLSEEQQALIPQVTIDKVYASSSALAIIELPAAGNITMNNKDAILAAFEEYDNLSDKQKPLLPQATVDKLYASTTTIAVIEIDEAEDIDEDIEAEEAAAIKAAKAAYDNLSDKQKGLLPEEIVNKVCASSSALTIIELPVGVNISADDATAIAAARAAFDAYSTWIEETEGQQDLIPQTTVDTLVAAETTLTIVELPVASEITANNSTAIANARAAYEALSDEQKEKVSQGTVDTLVAAETTLTIVELPAINTIAAENKDAIVAAKAAYSELSDKQKDLMPKAIVDKVFAADTTVDIVKLPDETLIVMDDANKIAAARTSYNALSPDQKGLVPQAQLDKLVASETTLTIVGLNSEEDITVDDAEAIASARAIFDVMSDDQKERVPAAIKDKLISSEVVLEIVELPVVIDITAEDEDAIIAAKTAYEALNDKQKLRVPQDVVDTLYAAETTLSIVELPVGIEIVAGDEDAIVAAREAYEALTADQKAKVPQTTKDTLIAAETVLEIVELPVGIEIVADDEDAIEAARAAYTALTADQKAKVPQTTVDTLVAAETVLEIVELPVGIEIVADDEDAIEAARAAYTALTADQKAKVPQATVDTLVAAETVLEIVELPVGIEIVADDEDAIEAARAAYTALTEAQKAKVPQATVDTLVAAETVLEIVELPVGIEIVADDEDAIEAARAAYEVLSADQKAKVPQATVDTLVAAETVLEIVELPVGIEIVADDEDAIEAARAAYTALTADQKAKVPQATVDTLVAAETVLEIVELPATAEITREDHDVVIAAREAYEALTEEQKAKVPAETLAKLVAAENIYVAMAKIEAIGEVAYTTESKALIDDAKEYFDALSEDQKAAIDNAEQLQQADTDYNAVDSVFNKIETISDIRYDDRSGDAIDTARQAYTSLTAEQKALLSASSLQKLVDAETVYETLGKIDAIGKVEYSEESRDLIDEARTYYDSLSDDQKALINIIDYETLTESEDTYSAKDSSAVATYTSLLVIVCVLLAFGLVVLGTMVYLLLKGKKKKGTKTLSVFFFPILLGVTHYIDSPFLALYVLAGLLIVLIVAILILALKNPFLVKEMKKIVKKEKETDQKSAAVENVIAETTPATEDEAEEGGVVVDAKGNYFNIRYNKSFTAKLIQSSDETKKYYTTLKNEILAYKKTKSSVSWAYDSVGAGRSQVLKFAIRGKTLCVYFALDPNDFAGSKFRVEKAEANKYENVPCMYRIKNDRRAKYAMELIAVVCEKLGLTKGEVPSEDYYLPFEATKDLVEKGLIKELKTVATDAQIQRAKDAGKIEIAEDAAVAVEDEEDGGIVMDAGGNIFHIRYNKSFTAKLIQSPDETKRYYTALKNEALAYNKTKSSVSWAYDSVGSGREQILKFSVRGRTLCVYFALNPDDYAGSKYKVEKTEANKYEKVPCMYRIKSDRRAKYAMELIAAVCKKMGLTKGEVPAEDYYLPYETTEALLEKGLIKELKIIATDAQIQRAKDAGTIQVVAQVSVREADAMITDEVAATMVGGRVGGASGKKTIVNVDVLSKNYNDGDTVTIEDMKEKKLIPQSATQVKLLARGVLDKKLHVELQDYSIEAVKMILATGGTVKRC